MVEGGGGRCTARLGASIIAVPRADPAGRGVAIAGLELARLAERRVSTQASKRLATIC
jgi:hypothetical protein